MGMEVLSIDILELSRIDTSKLEHEHGHDKFSKEQYKQNCIYIGMHLELDK